MAETQTKAAKSQDAEKVQEKKRRLEPAPVPMKALADESIPFPGLLGDSAMELPIERHAALLGDPRFSQSTNNARKAHIMTELQRNYGNFYVQRVMAQIQAPRKIPVIPLITPIAMEDKGKTSTRILEGELAEIRTQTANLKAGHNNESGLLDVAPHVFVNQGKTGAATVHWAGGSGGTVGQAVGDITLVARVIETKEPASKGEMAKAWVRPGSGKATVTRSYTGVNVGANGTYYITASAAARIDKHEEAHIANSKGHHDTYIVPLETRIAQHTGEAKAKSHGTTAAAAKTALETFIDWTNTIASFKSADTTDNTPGGTIDTNDQASADWIVDYGPRTVGGTNYAHYVDTPPGPGP